MKTLFTRIAFAVLVMFFSTGCLRLQIGSGEKRSFQNPTAGQQLIDLKAAKDAGAITDAEYGEQKAKLMGEK